MVDSKVLDKIIKQEMKNKATYTKFLKLEHNCHISSTTQQDSDEENVENEVDVDEYDVVPLDTALTGAFDEKLLDFKDIYEFQLHSLEDFTIDLFGITCGQL